MAEVIMKQRKDNEELGDLLCPHMDVKYQELGKNEEDFNLKFLFGGNISERTN